MKTVLVLFALLLTPVLSLAMKELKKFEGPFVTAMTCQTISSDYQDFRILDLRDGTFVFRTLDRNGVPVYFELTPQEWPALKVKIPCWQATYAVCGELKVNEKNAWEYALTGSSGVGEGNCH